VLLFLFLEFVVYLRSEIKKGKTMATVTINYDGRNTLVKSILRSAILAGATPVATKSMSPLDMALKDVRCGKVTTILTPSYDKKNSQ